MAESTPGIEVFDHTDSAAESIDWLTSKALAALPDCLENPGSEEPLLPQLGLVEVSLVDDETIARVHDEFMDDPSATDVITFQHGEILISVDTAHREGPEHGNEPLEELLLYLIHGLLHLNGHTDLVEKDRENMHKLQESILDRVLGRA